MNQREFQSSCCIASGVFDTIDQPERTKSARMATKQASSGMDLSSSLSQALKTLRTYLQALQAPSSSSSTSSDPFIPPLLPGLPEIVTQLTATLKQTTTSLALSFKPPITTDAAVAQLDKLSDQVGRLIACVIAAAAGGPWDRSALVEEWREGVLGLSTELEKLLVILQKAAAEPSTGRKDDVQGEGEGEGAYLVHTGLVWDAVDRMTDGMSTDEVGAVVRVWRRHGEVVRDAWDEFKEFLEDAQEDDADDGEDEAGPDLGQEDGEWGDLEKALGGSKMSSAERARAEAVRSPSCDSRSRLSSGETSLGVAPYPACDRSSTYPTTFFESTKNVPPVTRYLLRLPCGF